MNGAGRYSTIAIILHWTIAVMILGQIAGGWFMHRLPNSSPIKFDMYQVHKSFGITIVLLTVLRLAWRLMNRPPALPAAMPGWEKLAARTTHWLFYMLLVLTPLAGWAMVSVSPLEIPTIYFGVFEWPHLPFFDGVSDRAAVEEMFKERHEFLAYTILALLALHVGAALKHQFINRDEVLAGMAPRNILQWLGIAVLLAVIFTAGVNYWSAPKTITTNAAQSVEGVSEEIDAAEDTDVVQADETETSVVEIAEEVTEAPAPNQGRDPSEDNSAAPVSSVWTMDKSASRLVFIGRENSGSFEGEFSDFDAEIIFNPDVLSDASIKVTVSTASASTGDQLRDSNLPGGEWFDVKDHPIATFISTDVSQTGNGAYEARGVLTVKDFEKEITLPFSLVFEGDQARAEGEVTLIRTDYGLGANAEWLDEEGVALEVVLRFEVKATR